MDISFLNGVYYVKTESMLSEDDFNALKRLEKSLFFRYLKTRDYGFGSKYQNLGDILSQELNNVKTELNKDLDNSFLTDVFYFEHDLINIKIAYKNYKLNLEKTEVHDSVGRFSQEALEQVFKYGNDKLIPEEHRELFQRINGIAWDEDIRYLLQRIEITTYEYYDEITKNCKNKKVFSSLHWYLQLKKVVSNLSTFLKLKVRGATIEELEHALLKEEIVGINNWLEIYNKTIRDIKNKLSVYFNEDLVDAAEIFLDKKETRELYYYSNKYIHDEIKELSRNEKTIAPVLYYLYLKEIEAMKVRALYYGK